MKQDENNDVEQTIKHQIFLLVEEISSHKVNFKTQEHNHPFHLEALREQLDSNEQYEKRDALLLSGPDVDDVSERQHCKQTVRDLPNDHRRLNNDTADTSTRIV